MINLQDWFYYDESSPTCLRWKQSRYTGNPKRLLVGVGDKAGSVNHSYYETSLDNYRDGVHRIVWILHHGSIPDGFIIDHIDGCGLNNKISNLRLVTHRINSRNTAKRSHNKTGFTGVAKTSVVDNKSGKEYWYYTALWKTLDGDQRTANYSIEKLGDSNAFLLAITHRQFEMEELCAKGAGYTSRHGE